PARPGAARVAALGARPALAAVGGVGGDRRRRGGPALLAGPGDRHDPPRADPRRADAGEPHGRRSRARPPPRGPRGPPGGGGCRPADPEFDWAWWDPARQHVLVTVGTLSRHMADEFYARAAVALAPMVGRLQAVFVAPEGTVTDAPAHILFCPRVPMLDLMPR